MDKSSVLSRRLAGYLFVMASSTDTQQIARDKDAEVRGRENGAGCLPVSNIA